MKNNSLEDIANKTNKTGQLFFNLGIFFLATALPISGLFLIVSIVISFFETKFYLLKDRWNLSIIFIGGLFIISSIKFSLVKLDYQLLSFSKTSSSLDLFNWLPLFVLFISSQYYLRNQSQRELFSKYLISGTVPVLISCILQDKFNIYGPFKTLFGLIVFFNKIQIEGSSLGVSGLFSNPNYTGIWLTLSLPILFLIISKIKSFNFKKLTTIVILTFLIYLIFLTLSRNAIAGLISTVLIVFGIKKLLFLFAFLTIIYFSFELASSFIPIKIFNLADENQIGAFLNKVDITNISNIIEFTRIKIWINTLNLIMQKPFFGFGASTFPIIYNYHFYTPILDLQQIQHAHNMPLQLAFEYGLFVSIVLTVFITILFYKSWITIFEIKNQTYSYLHNKCFLAACLVAILNHANDVTYYDGKISILIWILFAGLKCIFDETTKFKNKKDLRISAYLN